ncbi:trigger factor [Mesoplasma lactucae]|uniref:Trigger factor n=1 Tax=Mesoplasma lactucae ATCC 49193 TaxID=81460 RepID=A0A291IR49_9MOLU|nr:trigger factor [Mesoplasma lactucae]ATG97342.1 trigger factor [Mesoplasma lactucae ATCC 49193]ATZ20206.1 trigger factor [Mesoplasma lactucae ATCC 49193]MCL8216955.1 Trigger factor [Mesoplasma lactucae ATCC 49193]
MKFTDKKTADNTQGEWIVTVDGDDWKKAIENAKKTLSENVEVPGFRKGKAPKSEVAKQLTPARIYNEAFNEEIRPAFDFALKQNSKIEPMNAPVPALTNANDNEATITFSFDLRPEVKLGEYKNLGIKKEPISITEEEIKDVLNEFQQRFAMEVPQPKGAKIENGDVVTFDFKGYMDGKPFAGGEAKDYKLEVGSGQFIPGFEEQMIGMQVGPDQKIEVTFPANYPGEMGGKKAEFVLDIKEIAKKELPAIDDELAKDANMDGVKTLDELKARIKEDMTKQKEQIEKNKHVDKVMEKAIANADVTVPKSAIRREAKSLKKQFEQQLQQQGMTLKDYKKATGLTEEQLDKDLEEDAKIRLQTYLVVSEIQEIEPQLKEVTDEEVNEKLNQFSKQFGVPVDQLKQLLPMDQIKAEIANEKLIDFLYENN